MRSAVLSPESPIHEFEWCPLCHSPAATALVPLLFPWHFSLLSPFFGDSPPSPLHQIQNLPLFFIFSFSYFWREWWEKMPVATIFHLFSNYLRQIIFFDVLLVLVWNNHWCPGFNCPWPLGHQLWRKPCSGVYLEVSCCLAVAADSLWRDVHITGMMLMCLPKVLGMSCLSPLACILGQIFP